MKMIELAAQYRESAALLKGRIAELRELLDGRLCKTEELRLRARIDTLSSMYRETTDAAVCTERYYDRGYRRNAKFTI